MSFKIRFYKRFYFEAVIFASSETGCSKFAKRRLLFMFPCMAFTVVSKYWHFQ